jgi:hypothetical protein
MSYEIPSRIPNVDQERNRRCRNAIRQDWIPLDPAADLDAIDAGIGLQPLLEAHTALMAVVGPQAVPITPIVLLEGERLGGWLIHA